MMPDQSDVSMTTSGLTSLPPPPKEASPRLVRGLLLATLIGWAGVTVTSAVAGANGEAPHLGLVVVCIVGVLALQILHSLPRARTWPCRRRAVSLAGQAALTSVPLVVPGVGWACTAGFLAASFALLLPSRVAWPVSAAVPASLTVLPPLLGHSWLATVYFATSTVVIAAVVVVLVTLDDGVHDAQSARHVMVRTAVEQERLRFSRDLHDILGSNLSAIALRCDIAHRLLPDSPQSARREVGEIKALARQALADARSVAEGHRRLSLAVEMRTVAAMLCATGVDIEISVRFGRLPDDLESVLATVLREGVANVVRHSDLRRCAIRGDVVAGEVVLELVNDGVDTTLGVAAESGGMGLRNLRERVEEVGGTLCAGPMGEGSFRVVASIPARAPGPMGRLTPWTPATRMAPP